MHRAQSNYWVIRLETFMFLELVSQKRPEISFININTMTCVDFIISVIMNGLCCVVEFIINYAGIILPLILLFLLLVCCCCAAVCCFCVQLCAAMTLQQLQTEGAERQQ